MQYHIKDFIIRIKPCLKPVIIITGSSVFIVFLYFILRLIPALTLVYQIITVFIAVILSICIILYMLKHIPKISFLYKPVKYILIILSSLILLIVLSMAAWYNYCFFPNDQDYLKQVSDSAEYCGSDLQDIELDLLRDIKKAKFSRPLTAKDLEFLQAPDLRARDYYIDINPYGGQRNNLKYSTGKIFYYTYQKNSLVLKAGSDVMYRLGRGKNRFLEFSAVFPGLDAASAGNGLLKIYYNDKLLLEKTIGREKKPDIQPFRYSDVLSSVVFYVKHPGRSVLPDNTGWEKIRVDLPPRAGKLEIAFQADGSNDYVFLGSPAVLTVKKNRRDEHVNIIYLIFDTFSKSHIDLYEYYDIFRKNAFNTDIAGNILGSRRIMTPVIDRYADRMCLFENMYTVGQTTRPSIVAMWTSQNYTKCRQPVFRNIVTDENKREFYEQGFATLGDELSKRGYFTKQISCNAQGHGVSGVGVDLGFDENYDYTMESSELTENFRRVIEFLNENQNRKFFLYAHINVPHQPMWIPAGYFVSGWLDGMYNKDIGRKIGNIRYLNDSLGKVLAAFDKLKLDRNTILIIAADHSGGRVPYFRGEITDRDRNKKMRESQEVAWFYDRAIYVKKGSQHMLNEFMNIPWMLIKPSNMKFIPGRVNSSISTLDVSPTLLDITVKGKCEKFSGRSFKGLLESRKDREKIFTDFIPLVGRFQRGFILNGRYKYWINLRGLYKYKNVHDMKYLMHQEYLFDLQKDPDEINNLAHDSYKNDLLLKMRKIYFERFNDYPDKNFIQISPSEKGSSHLYSVNVKAKGMVIYPRIYGDGITFKYKGKKEILFTCPVKDNTAFFSFETDPQDAALSLSVYRDGELIPRAQIYSSCESINYFDNPIVLSGRTDFHVAREPGRTGLEKKDIPSGSVYFSRIPLNYWMEMNAGDKEIQLSPGMKEVLRGWGYIQ